MQGLVEDLKAALKPCSPLLLLARQPFYGVAAQQGSLPLVQLRPLSIGQTGADTVLQHHDPGGVLFLADQKPCPQSLYLPLCGTHAQRPQWIACNLNQQLAVTQHQKTLPGIELYVYRTGAVQAQAAAVCQGEAAPLATACVQVGQPALGGVADRPLD